MAANKEIPYKIYLEENEMPQAWYNVRADMKNKPAPLLNPGTGQPMTAQELEGVFCKELVEQELADSPLECPLTEPTETTESSAPDQPENNEQKGR